MSFVAADGELATTEEVTLTVSDADGNTAPVVEVVGAARVEETREVALFLVARDADLTDSLALTLSGMPVAASFLDGGDGIGEFRWQTGYDDAGSYPLVFHASDGVATTDAPVDLVILERNRAPVLGALFDRTVAVGVQLTVELAASDADGDALSYAVVPAAHPGALFSDHGDGAATFTFTPPAADQGATVPFSFSVTDGKVSAVQSMDVTVVAPGNNAPVWAPVSAPGVDEGKTLSLDVAASDPDGAVPRLFATVMPPNASFTDRRDGTGRIDYAPSHAVATGGGTATVRVSLAADDGSAAKALDVDITVRDVNRPPQLTPLPDAKTATGVPLQVTVTANDPDGGALTYLAEAEPATLPMATSANRVTISPEDGDEGAYLVTVRVRDALLAEASDTFVLTVERAHVGPIAAGSAVQPSIADGSLIHDTVHNQIVAIDHKRASDRIWVMPLGGAPDAQSWQVRFPTGPPAGGEQIAVSVLDPTRGALFLFRSDTTSSGALSDVWRLDLTPNAETWQKVHNTNPSTNGCYAFNPATNEHRGTAFFFDTAGDRILCSRWSTSAGAAFDATPGEHAWSGYSTTGANTSYTSAWMVWTVAGGKIYWGGADQATDPMKVYEVTLGPAAATAAELPSSNPNLTPLALGQSGAAHDPTRGVLYFFGGFLNGTGSPSNELHVFDLATRAWSRPAVNSPLPAARHLARLLVLDSQRGLYLGGGCTSVSSTRRLCSSGTELSDLWFGNIGPGGF